MITLTRVQQATKDFIKVLRFGRNDVQTPYNCLPHGVDSKPVKNKIGLHVQTANSSESVIVGYIDRSDLTKEGETRIYATDTQGNEVFSIMLSNDGKCAIGGTTDNMVRYSKLKEEYDKTKEVVDIISQTLKTWTPVPNDGGAALKTTYLGAIGIKTTGDISSSKIDEITTL